MIRCRFVPSAAVAAAAFAMASAGVAAADAVVGVSANTIKPGQTVIVTSRGWTPGSLLTVELCGRQGSGGSADCAVTQQRMATADGRGDINETIDVAVPPAPCPCVVKVSSIGGDASAVAPVTVVGAAFDASPLPEDSVTPTLEIVDAHLEGSGPWTAWFGASPERDLVVTLRNPGVSAVEGAELYVTAGKAEHPTRVASSRPLATVLPHATTSVRVPIALGALWMGKATVRVSVAGLAGAPEDASTTSSYPWGLAVAVVVAVQVLLVAVRNRVRRRLARNESADVESPVDVDDVIDVRDDAGLPAAPLAPPIDVRSAIAALDAAVDALAATRRELVERYHPMGDVSESVDALHHGTVVDITGFGRRTGD